MTRKTKLTAWDCMFGDSKWVDYFNKHKQKRSRKNDIHCTFETSGYNSIVGNYRGLQERSSVESSHRVRNYPVLQKQSSLESTSRQGKSSVESNLQQKRPSVASSSRQVRSSVDSSHKVVNHRDLERRSSIDPHRNKETNCKPKRKEVGCKIELLWSLKCPTCNQHHACHCRYSPVRVNEQFSQMEVTKQEIECEDAKKLLEKENDELNAKLDAEREMREQILFKQQEDNDKLQQLIEERDKLLNEADEKKKLLLDDIENTLDLLDIKITGVENLIRCIEAYKHSLGKQQLNDEGLYRLVRSESNPSVLCIRPPTNSTYNVCNNVKGDCIRTIPNGENIVIHGHQYVNEDENLTVCNIINQILEQEETEDGIFSSVVKMFSCFNPFPSELDGSDEEDCDDKEDECCCDDDDDDDDEKEILDDISELEPESLRDECVISEKVSKEVVEKRQGGNFSISTTQNTSISLKGSNYLRESSRTKRSNDTNPNRTENTTSTNACDSELSELGRKISAVVASNLSVTSVKNNVSSLGLKASFNSQRINVIVKSPRRADSETDTSKKNSIASNKPAVNTFNITRISKDRKNSHKFLL